MGAGAVWQTYANWGGSSGITLSGLSSNTTYTFEVKARNGDDTETGFGSSASGTTGTGVSVPTAPTIGTPTVLSSTSIRWNFTDQANDETGFKLYSAGHTFLATDANTDLSYIDETGLSENTAYSGRHIVAYNGAGDSNDSSDASSIYTLADTPTNLTGTTQSISQINLSVDSFPNDTSGSSDYYFANTTDGTNSGWITINSWQNTDLSCATSYTYTSKYRNGDSVETSLINISQQTSACSGGVAPGIFNPPTPPIPSSENPQGGFRALINNGAKTTNSRTVTLRFNVGPDIKKMAISNTGDFTDASQEDYQAVKKWNLCSKFAGLIVSPVCSEGTYTVYAKFYTQWGQSSGVVSDSIVYQKSAEIISPTPTESKPITPKAKPIVPRTPTAHPASFSRNLRLGNVGFDVKALQQFLNQNGFVLIDQGSGSSGNETKYFGSLTQKALIRFQESYADKILTSVGLTKGTGYFGHSTREFINSFGDIVPPTPSAPEVSPPPQVSAGLPATIFTFSLKKGMRADDVKKLQQLLASKPEIYPEGLITSYFGPLTEKAVQRFQLKYGVVKSETDPGYGYVGPKTRAKLKEVFEE